jgi:hypothetical protein
MKTKTDRTVNTEEAFRGLGTFVAWLEGKIHLPPEFADHINQSRLEFLKGVRVLIEKKITLLETKSKTATSRKASRIKVK